MAPNQHRSLLVILMFAAVVAMLPNSILFPATVDISHHLHKSVSFVGLMISTYSVAYVLSTPFLGILSDHVGRRFVLVFGLTVFTIGGTVPLWTMNPLGILIGRAVMGIGSAGIMPMVDSVIGDTYTDPQSRRRALAGFGATLAVADALVPFLGGAVDSWQWRAVFAVYGVGVIAAVACLWVPARTNGQIERMTWTGYLQTLRFAVRIPILMATVVCTVIFGAVYFGFCSLLPLASSTHQSGWLNGVMFLPIGALWMGVSTYLSRKPHLPNLHRYVAWASGGLALVTILMGVLHSVVSLLLIAMVWGGGSGLLTTLFTWVIGDETPEEVRGAMNAVYNAGYVCGFSVGAPLFMWLNDSFSLLVATVVAGLCLLFMTGLAATRMNKRVIRMSDSVDASVRA